MFTLTLAHLYLLRASIVVWSPIESGAPAVMVTPALIEDELDDEGAAEPSPAFYRDVAARAGLEITDPPSPKERERIDALVGELPQALLQLLAHARLEPGSYRYANPLVDLPWAENCVPVELPALAHEQQVDFTFTAEHAALLRAARWEGMFMNPKRPYGDMTYFELDMAAILDLGVKQDADRRLPPEVDARLGQLHAETMPALQVLLIHGEIAPGDYPPIDG